MQPSFRTGARGIPSDIPGFAASAWLTPFDPSSFRSSRRRLSRCSRTLFRAYRTRARAPVGAGAVRAPDCARACLGPSSGHTSPLSFSGTLFRAGANRERKQPRADAASFLPSQYRERFPGVKEILNVFINYEQTVDAVGPNPARESERRPAVSEPDGDRPPLHRLPTPRFVTFAAFGAAAPTPPRC